MKFKKPASLFVLLLAVFCSNMLKAQPGWRDYSAKYFYTILDENGKGISFKENKAYAIMINGTLYRSSDIPQEVFKESTSSDKEFQNQILINDFSLSIPLKFSNTNTKPEIKIICKKDTMFIAQPTGQGSFMTETYSSRKKQDSDFMLQFIPGYYYFPNWAKQIQDNIPGTKKT